MSRLTPMSAVERLKRPEIMLVVLIGVEWLIFRGVGPRFATVDNGFDILRHSVEVGLLALALTPVMLTGGIDLSVGSLLGLCTVALGKFWKDAGLPIWAAAGGALAVGLGGGAINAALIARFRLPPLIVTLGTYSLFRGLAEAVTHGVQTYTGFPGVFLALGQGEWGGGPTQGWLYALVAVAIISVVHRMTFGREFRAIGFAREAARCAGIPVQRRLALVYLLSGLIAGLAAVIYTARVGQARADAGTGYEFFAITAVVLGGTSIFGGVGTVYGTILGTAAIALLENGLVHARLPRETGGILTGVLLIVSLAGSVLARAGRIRGGTRGTTPVETSIP